MGHCLESQASVCNSATFLFLNLQGIVGQAVGLHLQNRWPSVRVIKQP